MMPFDNPDAGAVPPEHLDWEGLLGTLRDPGPAIAEARRSLGDVPGARRGPDRPDIGSLREEMGL